MDEHEQIELGMYCDALLRDDNFNTLVAVCEKNFALTILEQEDSKERSKTYYTYQGLKSLLELMQQFVINKDQIAANAEQEKETE